MNVVVRADKVESAAQPTDPLDHLADKLFHKMGTDGVYARTELYEHIVERLAAALIPQGIREAGTEVMRFPPVARSGAVGEIGLLKEFPQPARLRLRAARHRTRDQRRGQPLRCRWRMDHLALARRSRAFAGSVLPGLSDCRRPRPAAARRPAFRRRGRLFPARALAPSRPVAVLPDARICLHRQPGRRLRFS